MPDAVTHGIELAVGAGCLAAAAGTWRRIRMRWPAALLAGAGLAAVVHAAAALAG